MDNNVSNPRDREFSHPDYKIKIYMDVGMDGYNMDHPGLDPIEYNPQGPKAKKLGNFANIKVYIPKECPQDLQSKILLHIDETLEKTKVDYTLDTSKNTGETVITFEPTSHHLSDQLQRDLVNCFTSEELGFQNVSRRPLPPPISRY